MFRLGIRLGSDEWVERLAADRSTDGWCGGRVRAVSRRGSLWSRKKALFPHVGSSKECSVSLAGYGS